MPRNVEIKAKVNDFDKIIALAEKLCRSEAKVFTQEDTFFVTPKGRLKLRNFQDGTKSQLIFYQRTDTESPKLSTYSICNINNSEELLPVLKLALGCIGSVKKTRKLFLYGQTRIHLDQVENLGNFVELEVVLTPDQNIEEGEKIANDLMKLLNIEKEHLIKEAYIDLLQKIKI